MASANTELTHLEPDAAEAGRQAPQRRRRAYDAGNIRKVKECEVRLAKDLAAHAALRGNVGIDHLNSRLDRIIDSPCSANTRKFSVFAKRQAENYLNLRVTQ